MAKQNNQTPKRAVFRPFGGIDTRSPHNNTRSASDMVNFRLADNGTLVKREGSHPVVHFGAPIRAEWTGRIFGSQHTIVLCGQNIICFSAGFTKPRTIATIPTSSTEAQLFFYRDRLYLVDGETLYEVQKDEIRPIEPYAPLIGKDWPTTIVGEIHEPRNLLTRHARIEYVADETPSVFLRTLYPAQTIDALYVNRALIDPSGYTYDTPSRSIMIQGLRAGDRISVYLTYEEVSELSLEKQYSPRACSRVDIFGDTANNRLFFWNGSNPSLFYPSAYVSEESLEGSRGFLPDSVPIYIPEASSCMLGDGQYYVTGFVRQYNRLLIFSENEVWMADDEVLSAKKFVAKPIHPRIGCTANGACTAWENTPIAIDRSGIYRFTAHTDEYNEENAVRICEPVRDLFSSSFLLSARVFYCRSRGELWFYSSGNRAESVWIYRPSNDTWYRFAGLWICGMLEINERVYFYNDQGLFVFDEADQTDTGTNGTAHEIVAEYHSHLLEYDTPAQKQFCELILCADSDGGALSVSLHGDGLHPLTCHFTTHGTHNVLTRRLSSGRFRYATLSLTASGAAKATVYFLISDVR